MRHGSLFSGIGGFDLAAEWMGWENIFHCEWMEFPRKVLDYHFPDADSHIDICKTDFKKYANSKIFSKLNIEKPEDKAW
jgi:DNA (cytosine-5)-methyltransferase 1